MIESFNCKETEKIWHREYSKKYPATIHRSALRKLLMIHASVSIQDLEVPPSNHLEKLKGKMKHKFSIRINDQYRIVFEWKSGKASCVEIVDISLI